MGGGSDDETCLIAYITSNTEPYVLELRKAFPEVTFIYYDRKNGKDGPDKQIPDGVLITPIPLLFLSPGDIQLPIPQFVVRSFPVVPCLSHLYCFHLIESKLIDSMQMFGRRQSIL